MVWRRRGSDMTELMKDPEVLAFFSPDMVQICKSSAPVSEWPIDAWCRAMGDRNPVYQDRQAARLYGHGDIVAPPVMMHSFTFPGLLDPTQDHPLNQLRRKLAEYGFGAIVTGTYEQDFITPIRLGDRLIRELRFASISEEKSTALGSGHFILMAEKIVNQNGEIIGHQRSQSLFYRPEAPTDRQRSPKQANPPKAPEETAERIELPPLIIPLSTTLIIAMALAANDFEPIHHDRDVAQARGMKDIFMTIVSSCGLMTRYVTDWAGPTAVIKGHASRFKSPNYPGDVMTFTGWADKPFESGRETKVFVRGANSTGTHIESTVTIA